MKTLSSVFILFGDVTLITSEFFYLLKTGFSQFSLYFCAFSGLLSWIISGSLNNLKRTPVMKERKTPPVKLAECGRKEILTISIGPAF